VEQIDCLVIGAGVVGLAVARRLAATGRDVLVVERAEGIGTETSSRNSEVIHAGIYYAAGSLKARLCVDGKHALYEYCASRAVPHERCGKVIVATAESQLETLEQLVTKAARNGVEDLRWLTAGEIARREPAISCVGALLSPSTGIIDSHAYMLALQTDSETSGALFAFQSSVVGGAVEDRGIRIDVAIEGDDEFTLLAKTVVNCAGLGAHRVAGAIQGIAQATVPQMRFAKGNYYTLSGRSPFNGLIYPVPGQAGLGVHVTVDLGGQARFGPDVEWIDAVDYEVDPLRATSFYAAVREYWPGLPDNALQPGYAGVRPKLHGPGEAPADFLIQGSEQHGVAGLVNLFGIESPGLTSSLAIAEAVHTLLDG